MPDMDPPGNADGSCKYVQVAKGDTCSSVATDRCQIDLEQLYKFNGGPSACTNLRKGKALCCTKGTLPDLKPKPNADGTCAYVTVADGDTCDDIAATNALSTDDLAELNFGKTWGFAGCSRLLKDMRICVSEGSPPFPAEVEGIDCGPQVPGTKPPPDGDDIAMLNQCPLNTCCNSWGYCGTTPSFCTKSPVRDTPGTAEEGTNGCISNCGLDIVNNGAAPGSFARVGYFEAWNLYTRKCLRMDASDLESSGLTHAHFAFANLTEDFQVDGEVLVPFSGGILANSN